MPNGQTVRIGFGKADSAPVAPAKGANLNPAGPTSPGGALGKSGLLMRAWPEWMLNSSLPLHELSGSVRFLPQQHQQRS